MTNFTETAVITLGAGAVLLLVFRMAHWSAEARNAFIGLVSGVVLFQHILTTDEQGLVVSVFAVSALGLFLLSARRLLERGAGRRR